MKNKLLIIVITISILAAGHFIFRAKKSTNLLAEKKQKLEDIQKDTVEPKVKVGLNLLKNRKDAAAMKIFEQVLQIEPDNLDALWGKAEVCRRTYDLKQSEEILNQILKLCPHHLAALNSLAYIRYKEGNFKDALRITNQVLKAERLDRENEALAYLLLGAINSMRTTKGWLLTKIQYGTQIKRYFERAKKAAPELAEAHLGIGTFYLKAPEIIGGNLNKAIAELELAVNIAPDFATANARLAQAYKKIGCEDKYNFYISKARQLDPKNEALTE